MTQIKNTSTKRPIIVWILTVYLALSLLGGLLGNALLLTGVLSDLSLTRSTMDWAFVIGGLILLAVYMVLLFCLRKVAISVLVLWLALALIGIYRQNINSDVITSSLSWQDIYNAVFFTVLIGYTFYLYRIRILR